jgi:uncharacterized protein YndB with AHSA1/START domain
MSQRVSAAPGITLRARRTFTASRERVFRAWTTPEVLKRWWCPPGWVPADMEVDLRVGGEYRIGMRRLGDDDVVYVRGQFLEVQAPRRLVYTWRWVGAFENQPETRVTVEFLDRDGTTEVVLVHDHFAELGVRQQHLSGWVAACDRMERIL